MPEHQPDDYYFIPSGRTEAEIRVKGSRFIARTDVAKDEATCADIVEKLRKFEHDATHHCSSWRLGPRGSLWRANDDGEPSGSAGLPILRQIESAELTNCIVIVTRYFGGTKLGTGGLIRAYGEAASLALKATERERVLIAKSGRLVFAYTDTSAITRVLQSFSVDVLESHYTDETAMDILVPLSLADRFASDIVSATGGRVAVVWSQDP